MGKWYQPIPDAQGFEETGIASWYGKPFHGRKTANGEIFNMYKDSAAHKTLPLDTWVRVLNLENKKSFNVRINDRGPFVADRIIDLSYSAAKKLGIAVSGTARVKITVLGARVQAPDKSEHARVQTVINENYYNQTYSIQVGAFTGKKNAEKLRRELAKTYENAHIVSFYYGNQTWHRVRVCKSSTLEQAAKDKERMIRAGFKSALVIAE
jgi:rare lipoprotein A